MAAIEYALINIARRETTLLPSISRRIVHFFRSGDREAMAESMLEVIKSKDLRGSLATRGFAYVKRNGWDQEKREYTDLIDSVSTEIFTDVQAGDLQPGPGSISADTSPDIQMRPVADPLVQEIDALVVRLEDRSSVSSTAGEQIRRSRPILRRWCRRLCSTRPHR
jgi:hypothetical protein